MAGTCTCCSNLRKHEGRFTDKEGARWGQESRDLGEVQVPLRPPNSVGEAIPWEVP